MNTERFWEVDFTRGSAILMMIVSNFITDLQYFRNYAGYGSFWHGFALITATVFIFLVGLSLTLSYAKDGRFSKFLQRGAFIFGLGIIITIASYLFIPQDYIRFGVLHLIGLSIILAYPFLKLKNNYIILLAGFVCVLFGTLFEKIVVSSGFLFWLGLTTASFSSVDFFPLFPWFGVVLTGIVAGRLLYPNGIRHFKVPEVKFSKPVAWLGRHSLLIYFIHQPILLGLMLLWF